MARFLVNYPDGYKDIIITALKKTLGTDADGLTDGEIVNKAFGRFVKPYVRAYQRKNSVNVIQAVLDTEEAQIIKEQAVRDATTVRKDAELAVDLKIDTDFERFV